jgi:glycosyltransferase involved in cell wall biosynthesis
MNVEDAGPTNVSVPKVSVIMPMLNARAFLEGSISSILCQSLADFELIVVDNGSTDGSKEYAQSIRDPRIRVISEPQRGTAHATNAGIGLSRADLVAVMDADDVSAPDRLRVQLAYMQTHPECVLLGTRFSFLVGTIIVPVAPPLMYHAEIRKALLGGNAAFSNGSTMFRAAAAKRVGGHRLNGPGHDFDFFLRMSEVGIVHNLHETLYYYRLHGGASTAAPNPLMREQIMFSIACAAARATGLPERTFADFRREWSIRSLREKLTDRAADVSSALYRGGVIQRANRKVVFAALAVIGSAVLNPRKVVYRFRRQWASLDSQLNLKSGEV